MKRALVLPFVLAFSLACSKPAPPHPDTPPADAGKAQTPAVHVDPSLVTSGRVAIDHAATRALRGDLRVPAEVVPSESGAAEVGALVSGRVGSIEVKDGDAVKRGQVLATVDSPEAARAAAEAIRAKARVVAASRKLERQEALQADKATSASAVDEARLELDAARADAAAARTLLVSLGLPEPGAAGEGTLAARVPVRSPIDGVVVERMVPLGGAVAPDKTLFRVVASGRVVADVRWTDPTTPVPAGGTGVTIVPRGASAKGGCPAHVTAAVSVVDERTRARRVRVVPDAPCATLVPGGFVDVAFTSAPDAGAPTAVVVPREAVVEIRGAQTVFVAHGDPGSFVPRVVRVGATTSEDAAIEDGLADGERVAVKGAVLLKGELLRSELESP